ncbi:MAG: hypothetical protein ACUVTP_06355 [Candidatus Fervidibacter sp.]|uniref:hypothetical protein n=1 Tax=Candidatus Fervidibacter sp. TaxID=3100871 RepID=UPI0040498F71
MKRLVSLLLIAMVGMGVIACRRSEEEQGPPPGAIKEPSGMGIQAPGPGGAGSGVQAPVRRPQK